MDPAERLKLIRQTHQRRQEREVGNVDDRIESPRFRRASYEMNAANPLYAEIWRDYVPTRQPIIKIVQKF